MVGRPPETEIVIRAKRGDADAYEALLRMHEHIAFRTAYAIVGSAADAEEVTQEAFVKAYNALPRFRTGSPFRPWLLRIVANAARNRRRSAARRTGLALRAFRDAASGDAAPSPEALLLADERRRELLDAVNRLRPEDRLVIALRWFLELNEEEMAAALDCPRGTVKSRLSRATARLRAAIGEAADD